MKNRILPFFLTVILLLTAGCCASAEAVPAQQIEAMLLTTTSEDMGEFPVLGYDILGQKKDGRDWYFYLAAAVCRYGYMGGYCVEFSSWSGPCTLVLQQVNGEWRY